jgi:hypothetical protein
MKLTEKEYYFTEFEKTIRQNPKSFKIKRIESGFFILRDTNKYLDSFIILSLTFGVPLICLFFSDINEYIIIVWFLVFSWRFYLILINENKIFFDFDETKIKMENSNFIGKIFIPKKEFYFNEILNSSLELKTETHSRYTSIIYQLYLDFEKKKRLKILNFNNQEVGKRFKQLINGIIKKNSCQHRI